MSAMKHYQIIGKGSTYEINDDLNFANLTQAYSDVCDEIKQDFFNNKIDEEVSWFFREKGEIVGGFVANKIEPRSEFERWTCAVMGYVSVRLDNDYLTSLLKQYIKRITRISTTKLPKRFRGKYSRIIVYTDNISQTELLKSLKFVEDKSSSNKYVFVIR